MGAGGILENVPGKLRKLFQQSNGSMLIDAFGFVIYTYSELLMVTMIAIIE